MTILHIIVAWIFIMAGLVLWNKFRSDRAAGRNFFNFGDFNFLIASVTILLVLWGIFSVWAPEPHFNSADDEIEFGTRTNQPRLVYEGYKKKLEKEPLRADHHFALMESYFAWREEVKNPVQMKEYLAAGVFVFNHYTEMSESDDRKTADLGNMFMAMYKLYDTRDVDDAAFFLRRVKNKKIRYYNYFIGRTNFLATGPVSAIADFETEINNKGYYRGSYEELAWIYNILGNDEELNKLISDEKSQDAVPQEIRARYYFMKGDIYSFYEMRLSSMFRTLPLWGVIGAVLILLAWLLFLRKLSFLSPVKWMHFFIAVFIGVILAMVSWSIYAVYHYIFQFTNNGEIKNDLLYCFAGIGFIEELVKLIPFLFILRFTNIIRKPIDYVLIASAAGLGFAFFENLLYISQYGLDVIHARALTASVSHMASSAMIAYGFVLVKYRYSRQYWIIPLFFIAAVAAHGFYDFWLLNEKVRSLSILTLFFYFTEILIYVSFINNALNQSVPENYKSSDIILNTQRLASFVAGSLVIIFAVEFVSTCFIYGTRTGNATLIGSFLSGGYLVFFLSVRLSNIDIIPRQWGKVEFFSGILPSEIMSSSKRGGYNSLVGKKLILRTHVSTGLYAVQLPITGIITKRLSVRDDNGWFEFNSEMPLLAGVTHHTTFYLHVKNEGEEISGEHPALVGIYVRVFDPLNPQQSKLTFVDWCLAG